MIRRPPIFTLTHTLLPYTTLFLSAHRNRSVPSVAAFVIPSRIRFAHRLARETRALGAVEFAMTAPFLILLYVGGFQLMDAISAYRKLTVTTRSLADLTSRQKTMTVATAIEFLNAPRQWLAPYSTATVIMRITRISIRDARIPTP